MSTPANVPDPSPHQLRDMVVGYLLNSCYTNTARVFARESAASNIASHHRSTENAPHSGPSTGVTMRTEEIGDEDDLGEGQTGCDGEDFMPREYLRLAELRREVKLRILCGRIEDANQILDEHFPSVLYDPESEGEMDTYAPSPSTLHRSEANSRRATQFPYANLARTAMANRAHLPSSSSTIPSSGRRRISYTSQCSLKPTHLALNLEILAFIEAARSVPLPYPPSSSATPPLPTVPPEDQQTMLLHLAQRLYAKVQSLKDPRDRDLYKKEMENVVGLLAYKVPESSSMAKYMKQERRDAVADQINSAILHRLGQSVASSIELHARQTAVVFDVLRSLKYKLPLPAQRPQNVNTALQSLLVSSPELGHVDLITQIKAERERERESNELVPPFSFSKFVAS